MTAQSPYAVLATEEGRALLAALASFSEERAVAAVAAARRLAPPDVCAAALSTLFARRRAIASRKFPEAESMLFTREGYEQASSSAVARHRSARYSGYTDVADLCCGIGSDTVAIAARGGHVAACDLDRDVLACAAHNAEALGQGARISFICADALALPLKGMDAAFADPSRRAGGERVTRGAAYVPPLVSLLARAHELPFGRLGVKVAPGCRFDSDEIRTALNELALEVELVSERGVCKEAVLWCGGLARADGARRATIIDSAGVHELDGEPLRRADVRPLAAHVGEPDPAVIRAGLIAAACAIAGAAPLDRDVAYVTADAPAPTPFIRWFVVRDAMGFNVKHLRSYLRARDIGSLVIKTRAFPLRPEEIERLLKPKGDGRAVLICTTIAGAKTAIVCDPVD